MLSNGVNTSQWVWWVERDSIMIAYYNHDTDEFDSPTEAKTVTLFYIQRPDKFLLQGESPERDGFSDGSIYLSVNTAIDTNTQLKKEAFWLQESEIPEQFHEALVARVIANGYERKIETLNLASYFLDKYEAGVKEAKKYSRRGRDGSPVTISPIDY